MVSRFYTNRKTLIYFFGQLNIFIASPVVSLPCTLGMWRSNREPQGRWTL